MPRGVAPHNEGCSYRARHFNQCITLPQGAALGYEQQLGFQPAPFFFSQPQNICQTAPIVLLKHQSPHYLPWQQTLSREIFFVSPCNFSLSAMTFFIFSEIFFVTNFITCVTNFVTCITNFVIYIQNFWIKNILEDRKKYLGERKIFQGERKNSAADICACVGINAGHRGKHFGSALVWNTE